MEVQVNLVDFVVLERKCSKNDRDLQKGRKTSMKGFQWPNQGQFEF